MKREAQCQCGGIKVVCDGDPEFVFQCYCLECQRRTGTSYGLSAYFSKSLVKTTGEFQTYERVGDQGNAALMHFCPNCGTNVYWTVPTLFPDHTGVAVGCFTDPDFPKPIVGAYGKRRHKWLPPLDGIETNDELPEL